MKMAHAPPGHHSVIGRPSVGGLHFPEYVVYRGEQVRFHNVPTFYLLSYYARLPTGLSGVSSHLSNRQT